MKNSLLISERGVVGVLSWTKAIDLAYFRNDGMKVMVLEFHDYEVKSPSTSLKLPSVMLLLGNRDKYPNDTLPISKKNLLFRDEFKCQWCGKDLTFNSITIDHVFPISKGGTNTWRNVVASCLKCNNEKGNKTGPEYEKESGKKLMCKPKTPTREIMYTGILNNSQYSSWKQYVRQH